MTKRLRKGEFLLCRDDGDNAPYVLFPVTTRPRMSQRGYWEPVKQEVEMDNLSFSWEKNTPKSLHLPPSGGPIRIRVERVT